MKKKYFLFFLTASFLLSFAACNGEEVESINIPIKSARATASVDVSERSDWMFFVNGKQYNATVNGRTIQALPKSVDAADISYIIHYTVDGKLPSINITQKTIVDMYFISPEYHIAKKAGSQQQLQAELLDQSTYAKILAADALSVSHQCFISSHLENAKLEHSHCMINFTVEGLPQGVVPQLWVGANRVKPFVKDGSYQAILLQPQLASLRATIDGNNHEVSLLSEIAKLPIEMRSQRDMHYNFVLTYSSQEEEIDSAYSLSIENMAANKWSQHDLESGTVS